jgi:hypothetical protein
MVDRKLNQFEERERGAAIPDRRNKNRNT